MTQLGAQVLVKRNDAITLAECRVLVERRTIDRILISPGPGYPKDSGISCDIIREFQGKVPIGGVCMGLQCIFQVFGGTIGHAGESVHGKQSAMTHDGKGLFTNLPQPEIHAVRYHSLIGLRHTLPDCLEVSSTLSSNPEIIMGIRHKKYAIEAVQFHPESILTNDGMMIMQNFLNL